MVAAGVFTTANLTSYCAAEDVLAQLRAYDTSEWGAEDDLVAEIGGLLGPTKAAVDSAAGRDFMSHPDAVVAVDGTGTRVLLLAPLGLTPVLDVASVTVSGQELASDAWLFYPEEAAVVLAASATYGSCFPEGDRNVEITLNWGYETPPADIVAAQAKLVAAELLATHSGEAVGVESVTLGDYSVRYGGVGRFGYTIRRLVAEANDVIARYRRIDFCAI